MREISVYRSFIDNHNLMIYKHIECILADLEFNSKSAK